MSDEVKLLPCGTICYGCGKPIDVKIGQTYCGSTDGSFWHYGCQPRTRAIEATRPTDMEVRDAE